MNTNSADREAAITNWNRACSALHRVMDRRPQDEAMRREVAILMEKAEAEVARTHAIMVATK